MNALNNLLKNNKSLIDAYASGNTNETILKEKGVSTLNEIETLKKDIQGTNYVQHFINLNNDIISKSNFVGSMLKCTFDKALINTINHNVINQFGISTGSLLVAAMPNHLMEKHNIPYHFLLLRVIGKVNEDDAVSEQLARFDKSNYFNHHDKYKHNKNNDENQELNAANNIERYQLTYAQGIHFNCNVLGMFYQYSDSQINTFDFTPQIDMLLATNNYLVFKPDSKLLDVIINTQMIIDAKLNKSFDYFPIGEYRETESEAFLPSKEILPRTKVYESIKIFMNSRTANFGNTRFGKSNLNKIYASNFIKYNLLHKDEIHKRIGVLIYDENGEYYHVNAQDGTSLYEKFKSTPDMISRYTLRNNENDNLMLNFYLNPVETMGALRSLMHDKDGGRPIYIESFLSMDFMSNNEFIFFYPEVIERDIENGEIKQYFTDFEMQEEILKTQLLWALLVKAGFEYKVQTQNKVRTHFFDFFANEHIKKPFELPKLLLDLINQIIEDNPEVANDSGLTESYKKNSVINSGDGYEIQFKKMNDLLGRFINYYLFNKNQFKDKTGLWERLDPLLEMFNATASKGGYKKLYSLRDMHSANSQNSMWKLIRDICEYGKVCILDLSTTTNIKAKKFYAEKIDTLIFKKAEDNFSKNLTNKYPMILLNYEEAHNLFPTSAPSSSIYVKLAREGAKMQIGIIYNTQFITSIYGELKSLTENTFVGYMNNQHEIADLANVNYNFRDSGHEIMTARKVGYMSILTKNRRFPIRVQIDKFE